MCYVIITSRSLVWFLISLIADMLIISSIVTPKWLVGPELISIDANYSMYRYPSVGIYTRYRTLRVKFFFLNETISSLFLDVH